MVVWALFLEKMVGPLGVPLRRKAKRGRREGMQAAMTPWEDVSSVRCCEEMSDMWEYVPMLGSAADQMAAST